MSRDEIAAKAKELAGHLSEYGESGLLPYRDDIEQLYWLVCRKTLRRCNCRNVLPDAVIEIYTRVKKNDYTMSKAILKNGAVIQTADGGIYTAANITDEVAREYLAKYPGRAGLFAVLPDPAPDAEGAADTAEATAATEPAKTKKATAKKSKK